MLSNMNIFLYETHKYLGIQPRPPPAALGSRGRKRVIPRHSGRNGKQVSPLPVTYNEVSGQLQTT